MKKTATPRRLALIHRDGTIIVDKVYLRDPDGIEFAPGAIEGLRLLRDAGFALVLITNQSGVARGYFDAATLERIHQRLQSMLGAEGLRLEAIYVCPTDLTTAAIAVGRRREWSQKRCAIWDFARMRSWSSVTATPTWRRRERRALPACA
jgi:HAD superfamily hydrolase (TIGR01662 family)